MSDSNTAETNSPDSNKPKRGPFGRDQPKHYCGKPGRSGAPKGNHNGLRHGLHGSKLPRSCRYIETRVNSLRRQVERAVMAAKGVINLVDAAAVNSIMKWERHGMLAAHWLRREADKMSLSDRLRFSEAIAKASDMRDKNIRALGLDTDTTSKVLDSLYGRPAVLIDSPADDLSDK